MKKIILIIFSITLITVMFGCQKTPEKEIVVPKQQDKMIDTAQQTEPLLNEGNNDEDRGDELENEIITIQTIAVPETYSETFQSGRLNVVIDTKITVPDCQSLPIIRVEGADFSQEQVTALFNYFCGDTKMYTVADEMTKDVIEEQIVSLKALIAEENNKEEADPDDLERYERQLKEAEEALPNAPLEYENVLSDGTLKTVIEKHPLTKIEVGRYTALAAFGDGKSFRVTNNSDRQEIISYVKEDGTGGGGRTLTTKALMLFSDSNINNGSYGQGRKVLVTETVTNEQEPLLSNLVTTPLEAKQMADKALSELLLPMSVKNVYLIDDGCDYGNGYQDGDNFAYEIECQRLINNVNLAIVEGSATGGSSSGDQFAPSPSWFYESFVIRINDYGIFHAEWTSPVNTLDTVVENCSLLSFSDIQDVFEKMMPIVYEYEANQSDENETTIRINAIELSLIRISEQDSIKYGLLVPAWRFYGTIDGSGQTANECFLTINAVDGSIIDTDIGY